MTTSVAALRPPLARFAAIGLAVWALATVAIRIAPDQGLRMGPFEAALTVLLGLGAVVGLAAWLLRDVSTSYRVAAMCAFVLPGMVGDSLTTAFCSMVFPNLPKGSSGVFGGLMLAGYAAMITVSIARSRPADPQVSSRS